jgi:hypothetical protein
VAKVFPSGWYCERLGPGSWLRLKWTAIRMKHLVQMSSKKHM